MALSVDDFRRLNDRARERVTDTYSRSIQQFVRPDVERREVQEYRALNEAQHGQIYQAVGKDKYKQYVDTMEKLSQKHGG